MSSGARREIKVKSKRRFLTLQPASVWEGMFGCIESHVQAMVVDRQPRTMFEMVRVDCSLETTFISGESEQFKGTA